MKEKYGAGNSVEISSIRNRIFETRRRNGTLNSSMPEEVLFDILAEHFGEDDILRNLIIDNRYPFHVDSYIKSLDLFIELNGDKAHNDHWFNPENARDCQIVRSWTENINRIESQTNKVSRYRRYIDMWTNFDVKNMIWQKNCLHYLVFWDGSCHKVKGSLVPYLSDARAWFDENCPMPENWRKENTY